MNERQDFQKLTHVDQPHLSTGEQTRFSDELAKLNGPLMDMIRELSPQQQQEFDNNVLNANGALVEWLGMIKSQETAEVINLKILDYFKPDCPNKKELAREIAKAIEDGDGVE